ncbi:non-canonical purine NTP diphosphatase [Thermoflexibacter ruber]|uniref:dITP/XTP pyrophosphatase n=1 Tax=Thermoflexibacter ruber TaxID=1003 RepID=A0A1I2C8N3_9BACT|nr:non-canonical purine NTP diphosphatase [Thermoflexibacter ruber]SFE64568.1 XTP/dITP diphosphohydrolase [Thermoflexibacter ruber]
MKNLVFATHNKNKIKEIQAKLADRYALISLSDLDIAEEIPETADTFEGNALLKAQYIWNKFGMSCFADDSGLEVDALGGAPGVHSARYAGLQKSDKNNIDLLLENLKNYTDTSAQFHTCIALILEGQVYYFHGIIRGRLIRERKGANGFGYDPIFIPEGYDRTFAEMTLAEKNAISHRAKAVAKLVDFLNQIS